jgi:hypothetical protein
VTVKHGAAQGVPSGAANNLLGEFHLEQISLDLNRGGFPMCCQ